jgi:uncharacterized membrane protein HdeD (DUF308 family)
MSTGMNTTGSTGIGGAPMPTRGEALGTMLAANWWAVALRGLFAVLFGVLTFAWPGITIATLVILFAAYLLVDGVFGIVAAVRAATHHGRWGLLLLEGIVDILAGIAVFVWPAAAVIVYVYLIAGWAIVSGGLMLGAAFAMSLEHGRWWLALGGVVSVIWGILLFLSPAAGAVVLALWLGAYALVFGITLLILAFRLRARHQASGGMGAARAV